ncbi:transcription antiterminator [Streptococcus sp. H31]
MEKAMLDKKSIQIINILISEEEISLTKLMARTGLSKKQILYTLDYINDFLKEHHQQALSLLQQNLILSFKNKEFFIDCFNKGHFFDDYLLTAEERRKYIYFILFRKEVAYLSTSDFLASLKVSKSTVMEDIKKLQKELSPYHIRIANDRTVGYYLSGDDYQIRYLAMSYILEDLSSDWQTFFYDYLFYNEKINDLASVTAIFRHCAVEKYGLTLTDKQLLEITYTLTLFKPYLSKTGPQDTVGYTSLKSSKEFMIAAAVLKKILALTPSPKAISFLTSWILTFTTVSISEATFDRTVILNLVNKVINRFELLSGIEFYNIKEVKSNLYSHFRAVHYRMLYKIPILNNFSARIRSQYANLFQLVRSSLKAIESYYQFPIPDEEVAYLSMHFIVAIEDYGIKKDGKKVAAVICQKGIGSSSFVFQQLKLLFPDFHFIGPYDSHHFLQETSTVDLIFSTENNVDLYQVNKNIFIVNPAMTPQERYHLLKKVYSRFGIGQVRFPKVTDLMTIISKNSDIKNSEQLQGELYDYLLSPAIDTDKEKGSAKPNLSDILRLEFIQSIVTISSYEEGIILAAAPLLRNKIIKESYLKKLLEDYQSGKIMQLTDLFCMPHARDTGGNHLGMSLIVLKKPYMIKEQTKVKYILLLSAPKSSVHLLAMNQLLKLLTRKDFFETLDQSAPDKIYDYIVANQ